MKTKSAITIGILCLFLAASPSFASIITISVEGQVTSVDDRSNVLEGQLSAGMLFTGYYSYDSLIPNSSPNPSDGFYPVEGQNCEFTFDDMTFKNDPDNYYSLSIQNDSYGHDKYALGMSAINLFWNNNTYKNSGHIVWDIEDDTAQALSNNSLPITAPNLLDWKYNSFILQYEYNGDFFTIYGKVTSAVVVPEPVSLVVITMGGLFLIRKRSKSL